MSAFRSAPTGVFPGQHSVSPRLDNCYRDYGVRNARQLGELLGEGLAEEGQA
jgi:hypothetical protein